MPQIDKSQAVVDFLQTNTTIHNNPLFFNFGKVEDNAHQTIIKSDDVMLQRPYIDGSVLKRFTFSLDSFKSVNYNAIVTGLLDENLDEFKEVQTTLDWVNEQDKIRNYPNFGETCFIEKMKALSSKPELVGVDATMNPPIAIYRISIQIDYIDKSDCMWQ